MRGLPLVASDARPPVRTRVIMSQASVTEVGSSGIRMCAWRLNSSAVDLATLVMAFTTLHINRLQAKLIRTPWLADDVSHPGHWFISKQNPPMLSSAQNCGEKLLAKGGNQQS